MDEILELTGDFNFLFGVIKEPYDEDEAFKIELFDSNINNENFNVKQYDLRFSLINEEILELCDAFDTNNIIEVIDALCDILYVVGGAKVYFNFDNTYINNIINDIDSIENNNTTEFDTIGFNYHKSFEIIKYYIEKINIDRILLSIITNNNKIEIDLKHINSYNRKLDSIIEIVFEISTLLDINIMHYFKIVHDSNMSKMCSTKYIAELSVDHYKTDDRYKTPAFKIVNYKDLDYYIIYDIETNKILKNINYTKVKFF